MSKIEWTDKTINFVAGCSPLSDGCKNCYAKKLHKRLHGMKTKGYEKPFNEVVINLDRLKHGLEKLPKKPCRVFINSMSDTFHSDISYDIIEQAFDMMSKYPQHIFQILTKRYDRLNYFKGEYMCGEDSVKYENVIFGISICNNDDLEVAHSEFIKSYQSGIYYNPQTYYMLLDFVSIEPLIEMLDIELLERFVQGTELKQIIVGGESGHNARLMNIDWVREIRDLCIEHHVPFFFKQSSQYKNKDFKNNELDGVIWEQFPDVPAVHQRRL